VGPGKLAEQLDQRGQPGPLTAGYPSSLRMVSGIAFLAADAVIQHLRGNENRCIHQHREVQRVAGTGIYQGVIMIGALLLGLFCGVVARMIIPGDAFRQMSGPASWLVSLALGLVGALVGYLVFTIGLGVGDRDIFDWGGVLSALIGTIIVLLIATWVIWRTSGRPT
jgi:uncharacterized membrane protein YeaQ/YmgE (transglycosylase-associated protein family)